MSTKARVFTREFKLAAIERMRSGGNVCALARELGVRRKLLYAWRDAYRKGGAVALRGRGRPPAEERAALPPEVPPGDPPPASALATAERRIAELERKLGQQALELDFFREALRRVKGPRRPTTGPGGTASTPSSRR